MKALGLALQGLSILFFVYWNVAVSGETIYPGDWKYTYNELPGSMWYPVAGLFLGGWVAKMGSPEDASAEDDDDDS